MFFLKKSPPNLCYCSPFPKRGQISLPGSSCSAFHQLGFCPPLAVHHWQVSGSRGLERVLATWTVLKQHRAATVRTVSPGTWNVCSAWPAQCLTKLSHFLNIWRFCKKIWDPRVRLDSRQLTVLTVPRHSQMKV